MCVYVCVFKSTENYGARKDQPANHSVACTLCFFFSLYLIFQRRSIGRTTDTIAYRGTIIGYTITPRLLHIAAIGRHSLRRIEKPRRRVMRNPPAILLFFFSLFIALINVMLTSLRNPFFSWHTRTLLSPSTLFTLLFLARSLALVLFLAHSRSLTLTLSISRSLASVSYSETVLI